MAIPNYFYGYWFCLECIHLFWQLNSKLMELPCWCWASNAWTHTGPSLVLFLNISHLVLNVRDGQIALIKESCVRFPGSFASDKFVDRLTHFDVTYLINSTLKYTSQSSLCLKYEVICLKYVSAQKCIDSIGASS